MRLKTVLATLAVASLPLSVASCAKDAPSTPAEDSDLNVVQSVESPQPEEEEVEEDPEEGELQEYFEAIASSDPKVVERAVGMAAPGSNAEAYAIYLAAARQSAKEAGVPIDAEVVEPTEAGFALCPEAPTEEEPCTEFTGFQYDGDKIADFHTGGDPLAGRLSLGDGEVVPLGDLGDASLIAAYRSVAGYVVTVFEMRASSHDVFPVATYIGPDGRQTDAAFMYGPTDLNAGALANYSFYFDGAEFGGEVLVGLMNDFGLSSGSVGFQTE